MNIGRKELVELLRSRGNDHAAGRAAQSLPVHIDLHRDRKALRKCGIDPNVLAFVLSRLEHATDVSDMLVERAGGDDDAGGSTVSVGGEPRRARARREPTQPGRSMVLEPVTIVGHVSLLSSS